MKSLRNIKSRMPRQPPPVLNSSAADLKTLRVDQEEEEALIFLEDNQDQAFEIVRALRDINPKIKYHISTNGRDFLIQFCKMNPLPRRAFIDLHVPIMDGFNVLRRIRSNRQYDYLPVIVLSASGSPEDRLTASQLGADAFIVKSESDSLTDLLRETIEMSFPKRSGKNRPESIQCLIENPSVKPVGWSYINAMLDNI